MSKPACELCIYWHKISFSQGQCRHRSPATTPWIETATGVKMVGPWPVTECRDWCGDFTRNVDGVWQIGILNTEAA